MVHQPMPLLAFVVLLSTMIGLSRAADVRLVSYNIQSGSGMDHQYNLQRTANAIIDMTPDIIGLQEVTLFTLSSTQHGSLYPCRCARRSIIAQLVMQVMIKQQC
jgi:endonuclease/exonuclease/phosphatase family metal-dependent hydrolase